MADMFQNLVGMAVEIPEVILKSLKAGHLGGIDVVFSARVSRSLARCPMSICMGWTSAERWFRSSINFPMVYSFGGLGCA
jgi:hypothetical protein